MRCSKTRGTRGGGAAGFTLIEVMVALAIIAVVALVLLNQRIEVVRDADRTRAKRVGWTLGAWKMGEIERDETLFEGRGGSQQGGFEELSAEYADYAWTYEADIEEVPTNEPSNPQEPRKEIFRVKLRVTQVSTQEPLIELEGMFPPKPPPQGATP